MSLSKTGRFRILQRDRFTCRYCGRSAPAVVLEVDHVHPRCEGGSDDEDNLVSACHDCNNGKRDTLLPVPGDRVVVVDNTLAHPDTCPTCWRELCELRSYAAEREEPRAGGYVAFYRCTRAHEWNCFWEKSARLTVFSLVTMIAEFNAREADYEAEVPA